MIYCVNLTKLLLSTVHVITASKIYVKHFQVYDMFEVKCVLYFQNFTP